jgi:hypothetical protein
MLALAHDAACLPSRPNFRPAPRPVPEHHLVGLHSLPQAAGPQRTLHEHTDPRLHVLHL